MTTKQQPPNRFATAVHPTTVEQRRRPGNHGDAENVKRALDALTDASFWWRRNFPHGLERKPGGMIFFTVFSTKNIKAPLKKGEPLEQWGDGGFGFLG